ncbi:uncharacterized protein AMSG_02321 [Thecamonas trahens ATCC 50062]|uniref:HECT-type E3 ubiquitin transferase n=1 Tax=Thecamonas trahens ATCC 50062 TaxID=461836 RepID=A0A0L0DVV3_THETB|nr:hypothetical protein AMSG_02321 [Thecamonas trahens ATCC 50062]KNC56350.1 hypothetical protein AMSG_02321 [Thecamonas trahens ATCC 50062]|eukprot:XP_013760867.1 hypothetical protein AMSG_02321 [Thecamonas trahens ATCC 50062]
MCRSTRSRLVVLVHLASLLLLAALWKPASAAPVFVGSSADAGVKLGSGSYLFKFITATITELPDVYPLDAIHASLASTAYLVDPPDHIHVAIRSLLLLPPHRLADLPETAQAELTAALDAAYSVADADEVDNITISRRNDPVALARFPACASIDRPLPLSALCSSFRITASAGFGPGLTMVSHELQVRSADQLWREIWYPRLIADPPPVIHTDVIRAWFLPKIAHLDEAVSHMLREYCFAPLVRTVTAALSWVWQAAKTALVYALHGAGLNLVTDMLRAVRSGAVHATSSLASSLGTNLDAISAFLFHASPRDLAGAAAVHRGAHAADALLRRHVLDSATATALAIPLTRGMAAPQPFSIDVSCSAPTHLALALDAIAPSGNLAIAQHTIRLSAASELMLPVALVAWLLAWAGALVAPNMWLGTLSPRRVLAVVGALVAWQGLEAAATVAPLASVVYRLLALVGNLIVFGTLGFGWASWLGRAVRASPGAVAALFAFSLGAYSDAAPTVGRVVARPLLASFWTFCCVLVPRRHARPVAARLLCVLSLVYRGRAALPLPTVIGVDIVERVLRISSLDRGIMVGAAVGTLLSSMPAEARGPAAGLGLLFGAASCLLLRRLRVFAAGAVSAGLALAFWTMLGRLDRAAIGLGLPAVVALGLGTTTLWTSLQSLAPLLEALPRAWWSPFAELGNALEQLGPRYDETFGLACILGVMYTLLSGAAYYWLSQTGASAAVMWALPVAIGGSTAISTVLAYVLPGPSSLTAYYGWEAPHDPVLGLGLGLVLEHIVLGSVAWISTAPMRGPLFVAAHFTAAAIYAVVLLLVIFHIATFVPSSWLRLHELHMRLRQQTPPGTLRITIRRENFVRDTLLANVAADPADALMNTRVTFISAGVVEAGSDDGGLTKEWLSLFGKALIGVASHPSIAPIEPVILVPAIRSGDADAVVYSLSNQIETYEADIAGRMLVRLLAARISLGYEISPALTRAMLRQPIVAADLAVIDPDLYAAKRAFKAQVDTAAKELDIELRFVFEYHARESGELVVVPLRKPTGELCDPEEVVNSTNYDEYMDAFATTYLTAGIEEHLAAFARGVHTAVPSRALRAAFGSDERALAHTLYGQVELDVAEWQAASVDDIGDPHWTWFWDAVVQLSAERRLQLLLAVTGCVLPPAGGLANLNPPMAVCVAFNASNGALPTASVCTNKIRLPRSYASAEETASKLNQFLDQPVGFGRA